MKHITLNVGTEINADGLPLTDTERLDGMMAVEKAALDIFGGVTVTPTWGGWRNPDGVTISEQGLQLDILTDTPTAEEDGRALARLCKSALSQQSVMLRVRDATAEFV